MIATSTSSTEPHHERSLQILGGQPGIMELIGFYIDLLRGKEFRMLEEFNELVIEYNNTDEDGEGGGGIVNGDDNDNNLNLTNYKSNNDTYSSGNGGGGGDGCEKLVMDTEGM
mmetsp:Transcript_5436/g.5246  ORF Transcript_5436/g.5246 Transcript_5436/m.5246 type:complete len:113 (+) Transcript_5436:1-339(+)